MELLTIFAISLLSFFAICASARIIEGLNDITQRIVISWPRKNFVYNVFFSRLRGSYNVTLLGTFVVLTYIATNGFFLLFQAGTDINAIADQARVLFCINLIPLYVSNRAGFLTDKLLWIKLGELNVVHSWFGRVCAMHGLIHGTIRLVRSENRLTPLNILLTSTVSILVLFSLLPIRKMIYDLAAVIHAVAACLLVACLWIHVPKTDKIGLATIIAVTSISFTEQVLRLSFLLLCNRGLKGSKIEDCKDGVPNLRLLTIPFHRATQVRPGQFVYLKARYFPHRWFTILQSHPYMVVLTRRSDDGSKDCIEILVECRSGFSNDLMYSKSLSSSILVDGPYGAILKLNQYDKVMFISSGVGIAAHLFPLRELLLAHENHSARVRRICVAWIARSIDEYTLIAPYLKEILRIDERSICNIFVCLPSSSSEDQISNEDGVELTTTPRLFKLKKELPLAFVEKEDDAEAGNMAVVACGHPMLEKDVRRMIRGSQRDIRVITSEFKPDGVENVVGRYTCSRSHIAESL